MAGDTSSGAQPLTTLARVIPGRREKLEAVLSVLAARIASGGPTPLDEIGTVHFARWVIIPDDQDAGWLLFTSNFDGPWDDYIEDFAVSSAATFDAIYANCHGWPAGGATDVAGFKQFVRDHEVPANVYYRAYPATVPQVKSALALKTAVTMLIDSLNQ